MHPIKIKFETSLFILFCVVKPQHYRGLENGIYSVSTDQFHTLNMETFLKNKISVPLSSANYKGFISLFAHSIGNGNIKTVFLF